MNVCEAAMTTVAVIYFISVSQTAPLSMFECQREEPILNQILVFRTCPSLNESRLIKIPQVQGLLI